MIFIPDKKTAAPPQEQDYTLVVFPFMDATRLRDILGRMHEIAPDLPEAWRGKPVTDFRVHVAHLLTSIDKQGLIDSLYTAGLVSRVVCLDGKWYACIAIGAETPEEGESRA